MNTYCGIDWAENHHDIAIVDAQGRKLESDRISDDLDGLHRLLEMLASHGDTAGNRIPVAIETTRGLLVSCLRATGRDVYAVNPMAAARYRDRHTVSRKKSDAQDAAVLANILRTDRHEHRAMPQDSELVQAIAVLARAQQDAVWNRLDQTNKARSVLREYYPGAVQAFPGSTLNSDTARTVLRAAPTPAKAAELTTTRVKGLLRKAGRTRGLETEARRLHEILTSRTMRRLPSVEEAYGQQLTAMLAHLDAACTALTNLTRATGELFATHPDAAIITSMPGLAETAGARVLAEIGDDPTRFNSAASLKAYAGAAPVTRASGKSHTVLARRVKNNRLAAAGYVWAFSALSSSPGARAHYDRRKEHGDLHTAAQRNLFNRLLGCLHHCLQNRVRYDESVAFPHNAQAPGI